MVTVMDCLVAQLHVLRFRFLPLLTAFLFFVPRFLSDACGGRECFFPLFLYGRSICALLFDGFTARGSECTFSWLAVWCSWRVVFAEGVGRFVLSYTLSVTTVTASDTRRANRLPICLSGAGPMRRHVSSTVTQVALRRGVHVVRTRDGFSSTKIPHLKFPSF